jgi:hypothetical protein
MAIAMAKITHKIHNSLDLGKLYVSHGEYRVDGDPNTYHIISFYGSFDTSTPGFNITFGEKQFEAYVEMLTKKTPNEDLPDAPPR